VFIFPKTSEVNFTYFYEFLSAKSWNHAYLYNQIFKESLFFVSVESYKEIQDSVCVAQRKGDNSEERVVLFLKMATGTDFTQEVVKSLKTNIRRLLSARHVPEVILPTQDIPVSELTPHSRHSSK
jgi:hypothetical protein